LVRVFRRCRATHRPIMNNVFKQVKRTFAVLSALFITGKSNVSIFFDIFE
jgi:hypothetical protein